MTLRDRARDEEAEPGAWYLICDCTRRAIEAIEDAFLVAGIEADARVVDLDCGARERALHPQLDAPALRRELHRVRNEVVEQLKHTTTIAFDPGRAVACQEERDAPAVGARVHLVERFARDRLEVGVVDGEHETAGLEAGSEEQVVDEAQEAIGATRDHLDVPAALVVERCASILVQRELDVSDDRGQRRAQVVRDEGDELVLQLIGADELLVLRGERSFGGSSYFKRVARLLERADISMRAAEFVAIQAALIVGLGLIGFVLGLGIIFPLVFAVIGAVIPEFIVRRKANARRKKFEDQLGDTLTAVASSLRAGQSFQQAMSTISLDGPEPISKEFQRVETETRLGRPADEALQSMADRLGSKNFEFVVLAVNIQRQVGGSLSEILDMVADTVRGRVQFSRKVRALTAMGRASAYVLVGMPFALAFMISLVDRSYLRPAVPANPPHVLSAFPLLKIEDYRY